MAARDVDPAVRLLCLPYAGGGAAAYLRWQRFLPDSVQVVAARLPGREGRLTEAAISNMEILVTALAEAAGPFLDRPCILFGHSMGSVLAYELAHLFGSRYDFEPARLIVSGRAAPQLAASNPMSTLCDDALARALGELGGTHPAVLGEPELLRLLLPAVRADLALCDRYVYRPRPKLRLPVHAFVGSEDSMVSRATMAAWRQEAAAEFRVEEFPGGHFYFCQDPRAPLASIAKLCSNLGQRFVTPGVS